MAEVRSGSFKTTGYSDANAPDHYVFSWSLASQSIVDNTTTINWEVVAAGGSSAGQYNTVKEKYVTVYGATKTNSDWQTTYNGTKPFSGTTVIKHDANGKGSFSASCGGAFEYGGSYNSTGSGSWDLPTIARATTPTLAATTITMGSTINITLTPADSTFKHKLRYDFGSVKGSASGFSMGAEFTAQGTRTITFTPPTSLGSQIPNNVSGTGQIICYTYNKDGAYIGTTYVDITLNIPAYTPTITDVEIWGNNLLRDACVQGKSSLSVNATTSTSYDAGIKSITCYIDDKEYSISEFPFETSVLSSGSKTVKITVVDTRDKSVMVESAAIQVYPYSAPKITEFTLERQSDGTEVKATVKGSIAAVDNKNDKTIEVILNGVKNTITPSSYDNITATITFTGVPTDQTLTGEAKFTDSYVSIERSATLPTVAVTMDFHYSGKGVAMGKVAEYDSLLDVAWAAKFGGEINTLAPGKTMSNLTYRGQNIITKASEDNLDFWASQGNLATAFFNNDTVDMNKPSTWGYLLHIAATPGTKEFHQLWLEQSDGSVYHRGANGTTINSWKKMLDSSNCADYVIEQGHYDGGWEYTKWNSGKIELFSEQYLNFPEGTKQADYLYRSIVSFDLSSFLIKIVSGNCPIQTNGMIPQVCRNGTDHSIAEIVIATSRTFSAFTIAAPIYIIGKWK